MKKFLALLLALVMSLSLVACGGGDDTAADGGADAEDGGNAETAAYQVAMITDYGDITDQSFNQTTYEACQEFCDAEGLQFEYYKPAGDSTAERVAMVDAAVADGYNVIVMPGYAFAETIKETAELYPDVTFIALDVAQGDLGEDYTVPSNVYCAVYQEELCGYMAGYAAVKLGYTHLGVLGGMAVPAVQRFGYGFVQGADAAAKEIGATDVNIKYWYSGGFAATDEVKNKMDGWYSEGTEVVFACGGPVCTSCDAAAKANGGKMIGVDVDQSGQFDTVITSAMKGLAESVNEALTDAMNNGWKFSETYSGKETKLGAAENCVGLPMSTSKFTKFTQEQYDSMYASIVDGTLTIDDSYDADVKPAVTTITVDYQS